MNLGGLKSNNLKWNLKALISSFGSDSEGKLNVLYGCKCNVRQTLEGVLEVLFYLFYTLSAALKAGVNSRCVFMEFLILKVDFLKSARTKV